MLSVLLLPFAGLVWGIVWLPPSDPNELGKLLGIEKWFPLWGWLEKLEESGNLVVSELLLI